jgi:hypothetical protein
MSPDEDPAERGISWFRTGVSLAEGVDADEEQAKAVTKRPQGRIARIARR